MNFNEALKQNLEEVGNRSITENGAVGFKSTNSFIVDMNFRVPFYRANLSNKEVILQDFHKAMLENANYAMKWLFYLRDVRSGLGERSIFRIILEDLCLRYPDSIKNQVISLLKLVPEYGRFDDLLSIKFGVNPEVDAEIVDIVRQQLKKDEVCMICQEPCSLLAKWMPSGNTSSIDTREKAKFFQKALNLSPRLYRKKLSVLRKYLNVLEVQISKGNWSKVDYEAVPSKANLKYKKAFLKHDTQRRISYLEKLSSGEAKINAGVLFPHDIVSQYKIGKYNRYVPSAEDATLEGLWKALPDTVNAQGGGVIVVRDGSGSMFSPFMKGSEIEYNDIATALSIYFAERASGDFSEQFITFSQRPKLINLRGLDTLAEKLVRVQRETEVDSTNIEAVFNLILNTAIQLKSPPEDIPKTILIISDMEFDEGANMRGDYGSRSFYGHLPPSYNEPLFEMLARKYKESKYELPKLVFWNVGSRTNTIPITKNKYGVILLSGYSVNLIKIVLSNKLDPASALQEILDSERYAPITIE